MSKFLFVTDLDSTFVGDDAALARLSHQLDQHRQNYGTIVVYATGRSLTLFSKLNQEKSLLEPDFRVLSVGTEIYPQGSNTPDPTWSEQLDQGWDRSRVVAIASNFGDLVPQPPSEQTPYKVSFLLAPEAAIEVLPQLRAALQQQGLATQLIYSSNVDLDILPQQSNKGSAVVFLQQKLGIAPAQTVVCGDSGNDLSMFQQVESRGIIVGNAQPELLNWHHANSANPDASGYKHRYLAQAHYAAGILEGLRHFGFLAS